MPECRRWESNPLPDGAARGPRLLSGRTSARPPAVTRIVSSRRPRFSVLALSLSAAALALSACAGDRGAAGSTFEPVKSGVLTVATAFLPAPGFWEGTPPTDGFEAGLADALAERLGLDRVEVVQVSFTDIVEGRLGGADIALSQITPTHERD